jgi:diguanylate cyclase (GGDEF)-like protein
VSTTGAMAAFAPKPSGAGKGPRPTEPVPTCETARDLGVKSVSGRRHVGVRFLLISVVLLPLLATCTVVVASATSAWRARGDATVAARDATQLAVVASASAKVTGFEVPFAAVSYAAQVGIGVSELDELLHPTVPFQDQLAAGATLIARYPTFSSTPTMRADMSELQAIVPEVVAGTISFGRVEAVFTKMNTDIDTIWFSDYDHLQTVIESWRPPASFAAHMAALVQTYEAYRAGGNEMGDASFVLEGVGPAYARQQLIQAAGEYQTAESEFAGQLGPKAEQAWHHLQTAPADVRFAATIEEAVTLALSGDKPPLADNLALTSTSMAPALNYLADLNRLVTSASQDLHDTATAQASTATRQFTDEIIFLSLLALVCLAGVLAAGRALTKPLKGLAAGAKQISNGDFDLESLAGKGPREVVTTIAAFNEMASTLKAVEKKTVALAAENLSDPELRKALPGRTGQALQASIDALRERIQEREVQRQLLHEVATHDVLTGLFNRRAVLEYLTNDVSRRREAGETVAVMFIDLDGLKPLNDLYGHETGDAAIAATAMALTRATHVCDVVGRLGGDEFLVVLCHDHSRDGDNVAERIRASVAQCRISANGVEVPLEASVGVALAQCDQDTDPMLLVRQADAAMYEAKKAAHARREPIISGS